MKKLFFIVVFGLFSAPISAVEDFVGFYKIDSRHTYPFFEVNHFGFSKQFGRFNGTSGHIVMSDDIEKSTVELVIDVKSLDMGNDGWDEHLLSDDFFNVEKYPTIVFKSKKIKMTNKKAGILTGDFTLLGITKSIDLVISGFNCGINMKGVSTCGANVSGEIKRSDYGMKTYIPSISDEIILTIPIEFNEVQQ